MLNITDDAIRDFNRQGYIVLRQILPTSLLQDLRRECEKAAALAHSKHGDSAQRLQPLGEHGDVLDLQVFRDYLELPALRQALDRILTPAHAFGGLDVLGVFLEPKTRPYCTQWHRDMTLASSGLAVAEFHDMLSSDDCNQINCPLYDDSSTWFVPGSHSRGTDTPEETAAAKQTWHCPNATAAEQERRCLNYAAGMPGVVQLHLNAGDFALYRPIGWHIGNYAPSRQRATLHDVALTPAYRKWWQAWRQGKRPAWRIRQQAEQAMASA